MANNKIVYPLRQVLEIKKRRVKESEKLVQEKKQILKQEEEKYEKYRLAYQKVDDHHQDKLTQQREALDEGVQPYKINEMKEYLKEVKLKRLEEQRKMDRQKKQVEVAEKKLKDAKEILKQRRLEVDKLEMHKSQWIHQEQLKLKKEEAKRLDEIGSLIYENYQRKEKANKLKKKKGDQHG